MKGIIAEQKAKQEFEFKLIQSQIKPHFLYNSLETILSLNKLERHEDAMQVTKSLASFYRLSLSKGNDIIKIYEEIQIIKDYLYIQKQRYSNYMDFSLDIDEEILDCYVPKLTLQPLVENSIYHGLKYKNNKGKLEIKGHLEGDKVVLIVCDDGVGISEEKINTLLNNQSQIERKEDFGLGSVDRRIKLLYGNEFGLEIQSEFGSYTRVLVRIPVLRMKG
jgi:two-component system, sensor histidine kinase YesM